MAHNTNQDGQFGYLNFADYARDMDEITDRATGLLTELRNQIRTRDMVIWLLIEAAGGKVAIEHDMIEGFDRHAAVIERHTLTESACELFIASLKSDACRASA